MPLQLNKEDVQQIVRAINEKSSDKDRLFYETYIQGLESAKKGIQNTDESIRLMQLDNVKVKSDVENIHKNVDELLKLVRDGNGKKSIIARLSDLEAYKEAEEKQELKEKSVNEEHIKGQWGLKIAILTGFLSLLATILQHFFK